MRRTRVIATIGVLVIAMLVGAMLAMPRGTDRVERIDFRITRTATSPVYDATLAPATTARLREFIIPVTHETIEIADGVMYEGWTYGGTVPGPTLRVREGDRIRITLVNDAPMPHSIDFHAARIPPDIAYRTILNGDSLTFEFTARDPGAYLIHCGTPPVLMHIMQGMYLAMIVDPRDGWGTTVDEEFVLVQAEFYAQDGEQPDAAQIPDWQAALQKRASRVVFNGRAFQYRAEPLEVEVGDRVRIFVVNAGPTFRSDFHIVGAIFDRVYADGTPRNVMARMQTWSVPAGGGAVFETVFEADASGPGLYPFVTHAFADAEKGAVGLIRVVDPDAP